MTIAWSFLSSSDACRRFQGFLRTAAMTKAWLLLSSSDASCNSSKAHNMWTALPFLLLNDASEPNPLLNQLIWALKHL